MVRSAFLTAAQPKLLELSRQESIFTVGLRKLRRRSAHASPISSATWHWKLVDIPLIFQRWNYKNKFCQNIIFACPDFRYTCSGLDDWIYWHLLQLLLITLFTTADNRWLLKTGSIPYWTTSVVVVYESATSSASVVHLLALHSWTINSTCYLLSENTQKKKQNYYYYVILLPLIFVCLFTFSINVFSSSNFP
jgi:hypothetical protein